MNNKKSSIFSIKWTLYLGNISSSTSSSVRFDFKVCKKLYPDDMDIGTYDGAILSTYLWSIYLHGQQDIQGVSSSGPSSLLKNDWGLSFWYVEPGMKVKLEC